MAEIAEDFWTRYSTFCLRAKVCPLRSVIKHLKGTELSCPVESIRPEHWLFLLSALYNDNSLTKVHFASCVSPNEEQNDYVRLKSKRNKAFPIPYGRTEQNIRNISMCLSGFLQISQQLVVLKLENLSLKFLDAEHIATGLRKAVLKILSFSGCQFEEHAVEIICIGLHVSLISWLDFSNCALTLRDIEAVAELIKSHSIRRSNQMFEKTLRYRYAILDEMEGLSRISLNYNLLENDGVNLLVDSMADDLWIKALDLQNCGIENEGAEALLNIAKMTGQLEVIDLRLNDIDVSLHQRISQQLTLNKTGKNIKYMPMPLWKPSEIARKYSVKKTKIRKKSVPAKIMLIKKMCRSLNQSTKSSTSKEKKSNKRDASVQTDEDCGAPKEISKPMQDLFNDLRGKLAFEMKLKKFFMQKYSILKNENERMREILIKSQEDDIYIDQETYLEVKQVFEKMKIFLDVMKKYGLWEYVVNFGFDEPVEVMMTQESSQKCVVLKKKENGYSTKGTSHNEENGSKADSDVETCYNYQRMDSKQAETSGHPPIVTPNCSNNASSKSTRVINKTAQSEKLDEKAIVQKIFQDVVNNYSGESHASSNQQEESVSAKQVNNTGTVLENEKPTSSKQTDSAAQKPSASDAHMFIKKFSYSNMNVKLKELFTPTHFYKVVQRDIEQCESEGEKLPIHNDNSALLTARIAENLYNHGASTYDSSHPQSEKNSTKSERSMSNTSNSYEPYSPKIKKSKTESIPQSSELRQSSRKKLSKEQLSYEGLPEDVSISELISRQKAALGSKHNKTPPIYIPTKKDPAKSSDSSVCSSEVRKSVIVKKQNLSEQKKHLLYDPAAEFASCKKMSPKSKLKLSISSHVSSMKIRARSNASSDEINSSDSIATASDKLSDSSVSSSSSNKSHINNSGGSGSNQQKSYIESVSDASTFKDVESISDVEVASPVLSGSVSSKKVENQPKVLENASLKNVTKGEHISNSSAPKIPSKSKKNYKSEDSGSSKSSTLKNAPESKKSDKPVPTNISASGKTKKNSKPASKNRPKGSPLSSSVPSLSDITTVSSQSLNTDSIMKRISGSEDDAKRGN